MRFSWLLAKCGLLAAFVALLVALPHLYRRVDEEVRRRVEAKIAGHYPQLRVTVRSAALVRGKGIEVHGLSIADPEAEGPCAELLHIDDVFLTCRTEFEDLLKGEPEVSCVVIRRPKLQVARQADGTWSASRLLPLPSANRSIPEIRIEGGTLEFLDPGKPACAPLTFRDVDLAVSPADPSEPGVKPGMRRFQGTLGGAPFRQIEVSGLIDPAGSEWSVAAAVEGLDLSPELRDGLPSELAERLAFLGSLRGQCSLRLQASYDPLRENRGPGQAAIRPETRQAGNLPPAGFDPAASHALRFEVTGQVTQGRLDDPRLPLPLADLRATFACDNEGVTVKSLFARSGRSTLQLAYRQTGYGPDAPRVLQARIDALELDRRVMEALPEALRGHWHKYLPSGQISADATLVFDGRTWKPEVLVECLDVAFTYHKFRYRLEHATGTLQLKDDVLTASVTGYSGNQPVRVSARVLDPLANWHGSIEARAEALPLDDRLLNALPDKVRSTIQSLHPAGTLRTFARVWREAPGGEVRRHVHIEVAQGSIRYDHFRYPVADVRGTIEMHDDHWTFRDLEGTNDTGRIRCNGHLKPTAGGHELRLWLTGEDVPLEEELRDALQPTMRQVWDDLRPEGAVDLKVDVFYATGQRKLDVGLRAWPREDRVSILPVCFPYRIEKLRGALVYQDGLVTIDQFKGEHGNARLATAGRCEFLADGSFRLALEGLTVDRMRLDRDLVQALPARLKRAVTELNPEGPLHLRGDIVFARAAPGAPLTSQWDLAIDLHQGTLDCGVKLANLEGSVRLAGQFDGQRFGSRGEIDIASVTYKDFQFTQVAGPLWIDDERVLLGSWVDRPPQAPASSQGGPAREARPITARLFGGTVQGDAWIALGADPRFGIEAAYSGGDLERFAREAVPGSQDLKGRMAAGVVLRGKGRSLNELSGHGNIALRDADIYELPLMVRLLAILSIRRPNRTAFSTADIDFRIDANHVYFDRLDFKGDAVSLVGRGEMNVQSEINLTFHARVGRGDLDLPLVEQVLGGASQQLMLIHVGGTLQDPKMRREAFPGVNQALQQLQADRGPEVQRRLPRKFR